MNQGHTPRWSALAAAVGCGVLVVGLLAPSAQALTPQADPAPAPVTDLSAASVAPATSVAPSAKPSATPTPSPSSKPSATPTPGAPSKACATMAPKAPWRLVATRSADDPTTVEISWAAVACATRYNVSVFVGSTDDVQTVDGSETTLTLTGTDPSKLYRFQVSSRNDAGEGASTPIFRLFPATPAGVTNLKLVYDSVDAGVLTWTAPKDRLPIGYTLLVTRVSDRKVLLDTTLEGDATKAYIPDLDSRAMFLIVLQPVNKAGEGPKARLLVGDQRPNPVTELTAIRDPGDPTQVIVTWVAPDNSEKGRVLGYEVAFGKGRAAESVIVKDTDASVRIPTDRSGVIIIRVLGENGKSVYSQPIRIWADNKPDTTTTNQSIDLVEQDGVITVAAAQSVANDHQLVVHIKPTLDNGGFTDTQFSQPGAQTLSFRKVPQGMYLVTVEGSGKELARRWVNVGRAGYMFAGDWKTTMGSPSIADSSIDMPKPGETRVLSLRPRATQDVVIEADAQLTAGDGYGFWFRTSNLEGRPSGLTFQYDPRWRSSFIIRLWQNGTECGTPIAMTPFPAGLKINGEHRIVMSAKGDEMWATLDGVRLFSVPSLSEIIAKNACGYASPTGTQVGLRKWTSSNVIFKDISIN